MDKQKDSALIVGDFNGHTGLRGTHRSEKTVELTGVELTH